MCMCGQKCEQTFGNIWFVCISLNLRLKWGEIPFEWNLKLVYAGIKPSLFVCHSCSINCPFFTCIYCFLEHLRLTTTQPNVQFTSGMARLGFSLSMWRHMNEYASERVCRKVLKTSYITMEIGFGFDLKRDLMDCCWWCSWGSFLYSMCILC